MNEQKALFEKEAEDKDQGPVECLRLWGQARMAL